MNLVHRFLFVSIKTELLQNFSEPRKYIWKNQRYISIGFVNDQSKTRWNIFTGIKNLCLFFFLVKNHWNKFLYMRKKLSWYYDAFLQVIQWRPFEIKRTKTIYSLNNPFFLLNDQRERWAEYVCFSSFFLFD